MPHNDFAHLFAPGGHPLPPRARAGRSRLLAILLAGAGSLAVAAPTAAQTPAQTGVQQVRPFGEDASTVPGGMVRLRTIPTWMWAMDQWTTVDGERRFIPLAGQFAGDSLGVAQITPADTSQSLIRALSGLSGFRLNLGNSQTSASTRTLVVPIVLEYGVTRWLTVGVNLPIVQTRTRLALLLNNDTSTYPPDIPGAWDARYNVGENPALSDPTLYQQNSTTVANLTKIVTELKACLGSPSPSCAGVNANRTAVEALVDRAADAALLVTRLYGTASATPGQQFVPLSGSAAQQAINASLRALMTSANGYLPNTVTVPDSLLSAAKGPAGSGALAELLERAEYDSVAEASRVGVGDIEVGAKVQLVDRRDPAGRGVRAAVSGLVRFGTGQVSLDSPFGQGTGDGQTDVVGAAFVDAFITRRIGLSFAGRYTVQTGETDAWLPDASGARDIFVPKPSRATLGNILELDVTPRYRVAASFSVDGRYSLLRQAGSTFVPLLDGTAVTTPATTLQRVGLGATYSTLEPWMRHAARLPVDVLFSYLQTVASSGGPAYKTSIAQIELRLYFGLFGGR